MINSLFLWFPTDCENIPIVDGAIATVNGKRPVTPIKHQTNVDYTCDLGYSPTTVQTAKCGVTVSGEIDVSGIACEKSIYLFLYFVVTI